MLDLPVRSGVRYGSPVDVDVIFIVEPEELLASELCAVVRNDGVRYSKALDDVKEEQYGLFGLDRGDRPSFYPFCELVYGDKQVGVALGRLFERPNQIEPPDREWPGDGDHLERLGR